MKAPAFQFYPKDYLSDAHVRLMTLEERGAYWELCSLLWLQEELPCEMKPLARLLNVSTKKMQCLWGALRPCFLVSETGIRHEGLDEERRKQAERRLESQRASRQRWHSDAKRAEELRNAPALHRDSSSSATADAGSTSNFDSRSESLVSRNRDAKASPIKRRAAKNNAVSDGETTSNVIWDLGVNLLVSEGMQRDAARSLLGKLAKQHGKDALAQAIAVTSSQHPVDCKSYLIKILVGNRTVNSNRSSAVEQSMQAVNEFLRELGDETS